jgi:hypothetical protein
MAFVDGHVEPSVDFPFEEVDRGNPIEAELTEATPKKESEAATLGRIFTLLLTYGGTDPLQFFITANVLAFVLGLHPNQRASGEIIAAGLKMRKAAWFRRVNQMRKLLRQKGAILPKIAGEWSKPARKAIQLKTTINHDKIKAKGARKAEAVVTRISAAYGQKAR